MALPPKPSARERLREVAERAGCKIARLVLHASDIDWSEFTKVKRLGITAGASAPEILVDKIISAFGERRKVTVETVSMADESVFFPLPKVLRDDAAA